MFLPVLTLSGKEYSYTLDKDTCEQQIAFVFLQKQDYNVDWRISYWSGVLNNRDYNPDLTHRKCYALVWAILLLHL